MYSALVELLTTPAFEPDWMYALEYLSLSPVMDEFELHGLLFLDSGQ